MAGVAELPLEVVDGELETRELDFRIGKVDLGTGERDS